MRCTLFLLLLIFSFGACKKDKTQSEIDEETINNYLTTNHLTAIHHSSGIYYFITEQGSGGSPVYNSQITVKYKGYLTNGFVFDQTTGDKTFTSPLNYLIKGWIIGIPLLQKRGKGTFFIPSGLGYGSQDQKDIPANSVLIFEIELINFK
jgi:FKBP-type peptidyl-prolyl cis-trans isomerase FkpA